MERLKYTNLCLSIERPRTKTLLYRDLIKVIESTASVTYLILDLYRKRCRIENVFQT